MPFTSLAWSKLEKHFNALYHSTLRTLFSQNPKRFKLYSLQHKGLLLDFSRLHCTTETLDLLAQFAKASKLKSKIDDMFNGVKINSTEQRAALHTALRVSDPETSDLDDKTIFDKISEAKEQLFNFAQKIRDHQCLGVTGEPFTDIVNLGIGGSYIGPKFMLDALAELKQPNLKFHFISSVDKTPLISLLKTLNPATTLFIVSSKSFTTIETLTNANTCKHWLMQHLGNHAWAKHSVAVTSKHDKALAYGMHKNNIFPLWNWVGGRYSVWSCIALPIVIAIGSECFKEFLAGAESMDEHFRTADYDANMPIIMALLNICYLQIVKSKANAIIPYAHELNGFVQYLQQIDMESNGKSVDKLGNSICYATGPLIFGEEGCRGQHAYHQLLHQGNHVIPADFILVKPEVNNEHDEILFASALSQAEALAQGKTLDEALEQLRNQGLNEETVVKLAPHLVIPGNKPSALLMLSKVNPFNLGALIALYEHRVFVQGIVWNINSFDQFGVELGKELLPDILQQVRTKKTNVTLTGLIRYAYAT